MHCKGSRGKGSYTQGKIIGETMGKSYFQLGLATTNKDYTYTQPKGIEDLGLSHELIVVMKTR